jgi:hypothetical protein
MSMKYTHEFHTAVTVSTATFWDVTSATPGPQELHMLPFDPKPSHAARVVDTAPVEHVYLPVLHFHLSIIIPPMLHYYSSVHYTRQGCTNPRRWVAPIN